MAERQRISACPLPTAIGLNREQAAAFVNVSVSLFDKLVVANKMPRPRVAFGRLVYDVAELEVCFRELPHQHSEGAPEDQDDPVDETPKKGNAWDNAKSTN